MAAFKVGDRVSCSKNSIIFGEGTIVSINEFREPSMEYAIDLDNYKEDFIFVGKENIIKLNEGGNINDI